jgi:hypothetical protein
MIQLYTTVYTTIITYVDRAKAQFCFNISFHIISLNRHYTKNGIAVVAQQDLHLLHRER